MADRAGAPGGGGGGRLQAEARALGDPTRYAVFRYLADAGRRVDVAEISGHLGLNHTGIRQHLARLVEAGLVDEETAPPAGRGRPRLTYAVAPSAESRWGVAGPYERLSILLAAAVRSGEGPVEAGRRAAADLVAAAPVGDDPVATVAAAMASAGFDPVVRRRGRRADMLLRSCPFEAAALAEPETICSLHLGMASGVAELTGGRVAVEKLVRRDPRSSSCRLLLSTVAGGTG